MISFEKDNGAVSESEMKAGMNGMNGFGMPLFGFPKIAKIRVASDEMTEALRETYSSNARSATDYGLKVFEISNANTASAIDFFAHLLGSKSVTDVFTLTVAQARKAVDAASAQNKELWGLAEKLATETGEPIKKHFAKVLHQAG
jgi:phasin